MSDGMIPPADQAELGRLRDFTPPALAALEHVSWVFECLENLRAEEGGDERLCRKLRGHLCRARGALLAALQARPRGATPDHEGGDRVLERVMADRAELGRMRLPPDVAGLMREAELDRLRRGEAVAGYLTKLLRHADALSALVRELYGVVSDLHADDPGRQALLERGRAEGRAAVLSLLENFFGTPDDQYPQIVQLFGLVRALGPCRPPLPPHVAEAEAGRLREALSAVVAARDGYDRYEASLNEVYKAIDFARAALAENSR